MKEKTLTILAIILLILNLVALAFHYLIFTRVGEDVDVVKGRAPTGLYQAVRATGNACVTCAAENEKLSREIDQLKSKVSYLSGELAKLKKPPSSQ
jgi:hypothetical protein